MKLFEYIRDASGAEHYLALSQEAKALVLMLDKGKVCEGVWMATASEWKCGTGLGWSKMLEASFDIQSAATLSTAHVGSRGSLRFVVALPDQHGAFIEKVSRLVGKVQEIAA